MAREPSYDYYGNPPGRWARLRVRWANTPTAYRYNALLYGLAAVALTALVLEVAFGESSPKFEIATQVVPASTSTTRPRPTSTSSTLPALATSTTVAPVAGAPAHAPGGRPTTTVRRPAGRSNPAPANAAPAPAGNDTPAQDVPTSAFAPVTSSSPNTSAVPSTRPATTATTSPPVNTSIDVAAVCDKFPPAHRPAWCP